MTHGKNCGHELIYRRGGFLHPDTNDGSTIDLDDSEIGGFKECWCGCIKPEIWINPPQYTEAYLLNPKTYEKRLENSLVKKPFWKFW